MNTPEHSRGASPLVVAGAALAVVVAAWVLLAEPGFQTSLWRTYRVGGLLAAVAITVAAGSTVYVALGPADGRKLRLFRVILAGFSVAFCLLLVETPALLGHNYQATFGTNPRDTWLQVGSGANRADPELIHVHKANDTFTGTVGGNLVYLGIPDPPAYPVSVSYDKNGFRNATDLETAPVAVIGDSFIEAALMPAELSVTGRLESALGVPVANLGQAAYGFQQELVVLKRYGLPLRPRVVLWFIFGGNDFRDVEDYERQLARMRSGPAVRPFLKRSFTLNSLLALSAATTTALTEPSELALSMSGELTALDGSEERVYFGGGCPPITARQWEVGTSTIAEAARLCAEANTRFVVFYIPRKFRLYQPYVRLTPGSAAAGFEVNDVPDRLTAWCSERNIPFVDLSPALEGSLVTSAHPHLLDDVHWNARGHEIASKEALRELERLGIRPGEEE